MKSQVIPAQITTVEDRIAGSLSLTQIMLLLSPVFFASIVFALFPPNMHLVLYKIGIILSFALVAVTLSLRIKEKLVIHWIGILLRYNLRAKFYVFNKNDHFMRRNEVIQINPAKKTPKAVRKSVNRLLISDITGLVKLEEILGSGHSHISFKPDRKGGIYVALEKVRQKD